VPVRSGLTAAGCCYLLATIGIDSVALKLSVSQYLYPPNTVCEVGRSLSPGSYSVLISQLQAGEILFGLYEREGSPVAVRLYKADFDRCESQIRSGRAKSRTFWAVLESKLVVEKDFYRVRPEPLP